jgi:hypothetical protein
LHICLQARIGREKEGGKIEREGGERNKEEWGRGKLYYEIASLVAVGGALGSDKYPLE